MIRSKLIPACCSALTVVALALATADAADAGWRHRQARRCVPVAAQASPAAPRPAAYAPTPQVAPADPSGFLGWINGVRARHGLRAVGWDAGLAGSAAANSARGFGHWPGTNPGRQNVGAGDLGTVQAAWLASPPHAAAITDPNVSRVGLANVGGVWTLNLN